jgi:ABC-type antimicrobial peptide transport system permease subunit
MRESSIKKRGVILMLFQIKEVGYPPISDNTLLISVCPSFFGTAEIGTLRALGFQRKSILFAFLLESLILGFFGGCTGLLFPSLLQFLTVSTMNFQTFSELAFSFSITPGIIIKSMAFSIFMGSARGLLPAFKASRMNIVDSLREV